MLSERRRFGTRIADQRRWRDITAGRHGTAWTPAVATTSGFVTALAVLPHGDLIAAGGFQNIGVPAANLAQWKERRGQGSGPASTT